MAERLSDFIILISTLIFLSICSIFFGTFSGPQIGHYINVISLTITIALTFKFLINHISKFKQTWEENRGRFVLGIIAILIHFTLAFSFIALRYGYTNWIYKNPIELIPPNNNIN